MRDPDLVRALESLRQAEADIPTPAGVEARVMAAWDRAHSLRTGTRAPGHWRQLAAVAAGIILAVGLGQLGSQLRQAALTNAPAGNSRLVLVGAPILHGEPVRVVRMRVPASTLTGLGLGPAATWGDSRVDVDVIVGEDGVARAIRVGM